jgi:hypothetical protein
MEKIDQEQRFALCYKCTTGLSYLEQFFYGNRCLFCCDHVQNVGLITFLRMAILDWKIYQALVRLYMKQENGMLLWRALLGTFGYTDINEVKEITMKHEILKELRKL